MTHDEYTAEVKHLEALLYEGRNPTRATLAWERIEQYVAELEARNEALETAHSDAGWDAENRRMAGGY